MSRGVRFAARGAWLFPGLHKKREEEAPPTWRWRRVVLAVAVAAGGMLVLAHGCHSHEDDAELLAKVRLPAATPAAEPAGQP